MTGNEWHGKKVLIVDDSPEIRSQLRHLFQDQGFEVVGEAANGIEALSAMDSNKPDLISLDIIMPEMDGMECYQFIKRKSPETECIFISILSGDSRVYEAFEDSIATYRFVPKPVREELVLASLRKIYDGYQSGEVMEQIDTEDDMPPPPPAQEISPRNS